jgi:hypothetical protein
MFSKVRLGRFVLAVPKDEELGGHWTNTGENLVCRQAPTVTRGGSMICLGLSEFLSVLVSVRRGACGTGSAVVTVSAEAVQPRQLMSPKAQYTLGHLGVKNPYVTISHQPRHDGPAGH